MGEALWSFFPPIIGGSIQSTSIFFQVKGINNGVESSGKISLHVLKEPDQYCECMYVSWLGSMLAGVPVIYI